MTIFRQVRRNLPRGLPYIHYDSMTDIDGTLMTAHTPDIGGPYVAVENGANLAIKNNKMADLGLSTFSVISFPNSDPNAIVSADVVTRWESVNDRSLPTLIGNYVDSDNYIGVSISVTGQATGTQLQILEKLGGSFFGRGTPLVIRAVDSGKITSGVLSFHRADSDLITVTWAVDGGGTYSITYTTTNHKAATKSAIRYVHVGGPLIAPYPSFDNLSIPSVEL